MRWIVSALIASTMPSRSNVRAISPQVHSERDRRASSGSSQASLVAYVATSGGKARRSTAAWRVDQAGDAPALEAFRPFSHAVPRQVQVRGDASDVHVVSQRQDDAGTLDIANWCRLASADPLELASLVGGKTDLDGANEGHVRPLPEQQLLGQQNGDGHARRCI